MQRIIIILFGGLLLDNTICIISIYILRTRLKWLLQTSRLKASVQSSEENLNGDCNVNYITDNMDSSVQVHFLFMIKI